MNAPPPPARALLPLAVAVAVAVGAVLWAYWATLAEAAERWATDPQYSHGFLVPVFAAYLLWHRRDKLAGADLTPPAWVSSNPLTRLPLVGPLVGLVVGLVVGVIYGVASVWVRVAATDFRPRWWGVGLVLAGAAGRMASWLYYQPWLDPLSMLVVLAGLVACAGGRRALNWAWPGVVFLGFMIPLPYTFQVLLGGQLQEIATRCSTFALQTVGIPAVREGNVILLTHERLGVVEACSGLSMLVTFFALATAVAILSHRTWAEKGLIVLSAMPIAVLSNVARITATAVLYEFNKGEAARVVFHDGAGYLMMPFALGLLLLELHVLGRAVVPVAGPPTRAGRLAAFAPTS